VNIARKSNKGGEGMRVIHQQGFQAPREKRGDKNERSTVVLKPLVTTKKERKAFGHEEELAVERPKTIEDCPSGPCPWVGCKYHLYLNVKPNGRVQFNFPELEVWQIPETCALRVTKRGGITLEEVGELNNMTREMARQVVKGALAKLEVAVEEEWLEDTDLLGVDLGPDGIDRIKTEVEVREYYLARYMEGEFKFGKE